MEGAEFGVQWRIFLVVQASKSICKSILLI